MCVLPLTLCQLVYAPAFWNPEQGKAAIECEWMDAHCKLCHRKFNIPSLTIPDSVLKKKTFSMNLHLQLKKTGKNRGPQYDNDPKRELKLYTVMVAPKEDDSDGMAEPGFNKHFNKVLV